MSPNRKPSSVRTVIRFTSSAFNCTDVKDYFINPGCFGDDLAMLIASKWHAQGYDVQPPFQEDWGWSALLKYGSTWYSLDVGLFDSGRATETNPCVWLMFIRRSCGFWESLLAEEILA